MEEELIVIEDDSEEELITIEEGEVFVYPELQEKEVTPTGEVQEITADEGVYGLSKVTVNKVNLQDKTVNPASYQQIITADSEYSGLNKVVINPIPETDIYDPFGIKTILENDKEDYPYKVIVLFPDVDMPTYKIDNFGILGYKLSDGQVQFYDSVTYNVEFTPDRTKSVLNKSGTKMMYIILYTNENVMQGIGNVSCFHNYFKVVYSGMQISTLFNSYNQFNVKEIDFINGGCFTGTTNSLNSLNPLEKFLQNNNYYPKLTRLNLNYSYFLREIGDFDFNGVSLYSTSSSYAGGTCYNLTNIGEVSNINIEFYFSSAKMLTRQSILNLFYGLIDLTGQTPKKLTLGSFNLEKLSQEDKSIAINKNWTLT